MMKKINATKTQHFIQYLLCISLMINISVQTAFAQGDKGKKDIVVSGTVVDETGITLPSVNIYLKDRPGVGFVSDVDGNFTISGSKTVSYTHLTLPTN